MPYRQADTPFTSKEEENVELDQASQEILDGELPKVSNEEQNEAQEQAPQEIFSGELLSVQTSAEPTIIRLNSDTPLPSKADPEGMYWVRADFQGYWATAHILPPTTWWKNNVHDVLYKVRGDEERYWAYCDFDKYWAAFWVPGTMLMLRWMYTTVCDFCHGGYLMSWEVLYLIRTAWLHVKSLIRCRVEINVIYTEKEEGRSEEISTKDSDKHDFDDMVNRLQAIVPTPPEPVPNLHLPPPRLDLIEEVPQLVQIEENAHLESHRSSSVVTAQSASMESEDSAPRSRPKNEKEDAYFEYFTK